MSYQFPHDIDERVKSRMISRGFVSEDDVLREAMDALDQIEQDKLVRWHERNQTAIEQSRLGLSKELDLDAMIARVEDRVAKLSQGNQMKRAVWTPLAESELEEILFYIRIVDGRPETSRRIGEELRDCVD